MWAGLSHAGNKRKEEKIKQLSSWKGRSKGERERDAKRMWKETLLGSKIRH